MSDKKNLMPNPNDSATMFPRQPEIGCDDCAFDNTEACESETGTLCHNFKPKPERRLSFFMGTPNEKGEIEYTKIATAPFPPESAGWTPRTLNVKVGDTVIWPDGKKVICAAVSQPKPSAGEGRKCNSKLCALCKNRGDYCYRSLKCIPCINNPATDGKENRFESMEDSLRQERDELKAEVERLKQPKPTEQLAGRADGLCPKCGKPIGATTLCPFCGEHFAPYNPTTDWKAEYDRLLVEYRKLVDYRDKQDGTPCEQIRHQQEVADLHERLNEAQKESAEWEARTSSLLLTGAFDNNTAGEIQSWLKDYKSRRAEALATMKSVRCVISACVDTIEAGHPVAPNLESLKHCVEIIKKGEAGR